MIDTVILDIEGTICPITFVKEQLYPYFTDRFPAIVNALPFPLLPNEDDAITTLLLQLPTDITTSPQKIIDFFDDLVKRDIKHPILKGLQGYIWKEGYEKGDIVAPIYSDAIKFIEHYPGKIYIYSSGSIKAQKLLFAYVGSDNKSIDLNHRLSGYFDITTAGYKNESASYTTILHAIEKQPETVLFLSDNVNEVAAALKAGMHSTVVIRPGNAPLSSEDAQKFKTIHSLDELNI